MKNIWQFLMTCLVAGGIAFAVTSSTGATTTPQTRETVYDRIMHTHEIRCGYVYYPPLLMKDPNTGAFSGIGADVMRRVAELMNVKLIWTEETSWATYIEGLQTNRYDMLCTLDFFLPFYAGKVETTSPLFYTGIGIYKRADDTRFPEVFRNFDNPDITVSAIDGSIAMHIQESDYPHAKLLSVPNMSDYAFTLMNVVNKKADITFVERAVGNNFLKTNPGAVVNIADKEPLRIYPYFVPFKIGETKLQSTLNGLIIFLRDNSEIDKILSRYENGTPSFYRVAKGYR